MSWGRRRGGSCLVQRPRTRGSAVPPGRPPRSGGGRARGRCRGCAADRDPQMAGDELVAEARADRDRTAGGLEALADVARYRAWRACVWRTYACSRCSGRSAASCDARSTVGVRLAVVAAAPEVVGEFGERSRLLERGALLLPAADRLADDLDGLGLVVCEVSARPGTSFEEGRHGRRERDRGRIGGRARTGRLLRDVRPALAACAAAAGANRSTASAVGRLLGVMRDARQVGVGHEASPSAPAASSDAMRGDGEGDSGFLDGRARELVPEGDSAACGEWRTPLAMHSSTASIGLAAHDEQERRIERGRRDRRRLDDSSRLWAELRDPRQRGRPRTEPGISCAPREPGAPDVERVARREPARRCRHREHQHTSTSRATPWRWELAGRSEPLDPRPRSRDLRERCGADGRAAELVVAVGDEREAGAGLRSSDPSSRRATSQRALVRPVHILDDDDERLPLVGRTARSPRRRRRVARSTDRVPRRSHPGRARRSPRTAQVGAGSAEWVAPAPEGPPSRSAAQSQKTRRTREVLPTPASPPTRTSRPRDRTPSP